MIATRQRWLRATAVAAGVVAAALLAARSGLGVRSVYDPYSQLCVDRKTYLQAVDKGDEGAISAAIGRLRTDIAIQANGIRADVKQEVDAASSGDPSQIRRQYRINCADAFSPGSPAPTG